MKSQLKLTVGLLVTIFLSACAGGSGSGALNCPVTAGSYEENERDLEVNEADVQVSAAELFSEESDRWIVGTKSKVLKPSGETKRRFVVSGLEVQYEVINDNTFTVDLTGTDREAILNHLEQNFEIDFIEPDYKVEGLSEVDLNAIPKQWAHANIGTEQAWQSGRGSEAVVVAVADSGIDFSHPELKGSEWVNPIERPNGIDDDGNGYVDDMHGWNFVERNNRPSPTTSKRADFHGTHVAGIIAGRQNTGKGVSGVAPQVKLMALRFLNGNKSGYTSDAVKSIRYATDKNVKIINASFGSYRKSQALINEIRRAESRGVLIVAAAGNLGQNNDTRPFYPASYPHSNIISVTASSSSNRWVSGINYGVRSVDIAAPGSAILSTDSGHGYVSRTGSSMAAPFVSGVAALLLSQNPNLAAPHLRGMILQGADQFNTLSNRVSNGRRLSAVGSTKQVKNGGEMYPPPIEPCELQIESI